jgi:hypothetical protein
VIAARFDYARPPLVPTVVSASLEVALVLLESARTCAREGSPAAALVLYDQVVARYSEAAEPAIQALVARALVNKAVTVGRTDPAAEIALYDEMIARYGEAAEPAIQAAVARALVYKAITVGQTDAAAAIVLYDQVIAHYGQSTSQLVAEVVAAARTARSAVL